ncbi:hypothetical protein C0Q70_19578 [Pomacea canaliculata]|uniref:Uncharacterized protein n=1 Tax=Pomacea canaliculata TaxID=400727 RepID=A0A2T7NJR2_POMCA|nr:hypothetical protein C0Q70_19578 [Pomacea canaliculata]
MDVEEDSDDHYDTLNNSQECSEHLTTRWTVHTEQQQQLQQQCMAMLFCPLEELKYMYESCPTRKFASILFLAKLGARARFLYFRMGDVTDARSHATGSLLRGIGWTGKGEMIHDQRDNFVVPRM